MSFRLLSLVLFCFITCSKAWAVTPLLLKDIHQGSLGSAYQTGSVAYNSISSFHKISDTSVIFIINNEGGPELWRTDGTEPGTILIKELHSESPQGVWRNIVEKGSNAYFILDDVLWKTDGTANGTTAIELNVLPYEIVMLNGKILLSAYSMQQAARQLLEFDGENGGLTLIKQFCNGLQYIEQNAIFDNRLYFSADDCSGAGGELWSSDGTTEGTVLEKDIKIQNSESPFTNSNPTNFLAVGDRLYFQADHTDFGMELWSVSSESIEMVTDYVGGKSSSSPLLRAAIGQKVLFTSWQGANSDGVRRLSVSDGTSSGTILLSNSRVYDGPPPIVLGNNVFYVDADSKYLRKNTGSLAGDTLAAGVQVYSPLTVAGNLVFFNGKNSATGMELHAYDSISNAEWLVSDIQSGAVSSFPEHICVLNGRVLFFADDGVHGREPQVLDLSQVSPPPPPTGNSNDDSGGGGGGGSFVWPIAFLMLLGLRIVIRKN